MKNYGRHADVIHINDLC